MILYGLGDREQTLRFQVVTFESPNTTDDAALRSYHFELGGLPPQSVPFDVLSINTLPSNAPNLCFPGFFHSEPSSRLLALEIQVLKQSLIAGSRRSSIPLHVFYVPHAVFLDYIKSHPSDTDTVVVPWDAWGPGNTHILTPPRQPPYTARVFDSKIVCGMHAVNEPPIVISQGGRKMLRIMDYHPRRIIRNPVTQDMHLRGAADSREGLGSSGTTAWQEVSTSTDENIPYTSKDILLPGELRWENNTTKCVLGEDVVAVFEVCIPNLSTVRRAYSHILVCFGFFR